MLFNHLNHKALKKELLPMALLPMFFLNTITQPVSAEGISLKVVPSVLQIRTQSPADLRAPFIIENQDDRSVKLKLGYKLINAEKSKEGKVVYLEDQTKGNEIFKYIEVIDSQENAIDSLELGPGQQKQLNIRINVPANQPSRDHYFSLVFLHDIAPVTDQNSTKKDRKDQHTISTIQGGIAANVLLAVGPPETAQGYIEDFSSPIYLQSGPVPFSVKVKNDGLHYINPKGTIMIKNFFGQTVGKVELPSATVLAGTERTLLDKNQLEAIQRDSEAKALWQEKFLLGLYSAELKIAMATEGPVYNQTIRFFAFPIHLALGLVVAIVLVSSIYIRVKKKISQ